jgi:hypothetical protein
MHVHVWPGDDIERLDVLVDFAPNHARIRIIDADNERWEACAAALVR